MKRILILLCLFRLPMFGEVHYIEDLPNDIDDPREMYIDLMKKVLINSIYFYELENQAVGRRLQGRDWPQVAHTMVGIKRLNNVHHCARKIFENDVPGDFVETGVWRGGVTILMRALLKAYGDKTRKVWVADSFQGLPPPNLAKYPKDSFSKLHTRKKLRISLETVQQNFRKYGLLDNQVVFLKGWFSETLPEAPIEQIALLRLDGDLYESTMDALTSLYDKVSVGGFIIIDDYGSIAACASAVTDFRRARNITDPIIKVDTTGVYWQKSEK